MGDRVRRVWHTLWGRVLVVGMALVVLLAGASYAAAKSTESNRFCGTACHEMLPYDHTWAASKHASVDCVTCHIPPGLWSLAKTKFFALREVYVHVLGAGNKPIVVTRQIPNVVCVECHPAGRLAQPIKLFTTSFSHAGHRKVPLCVDCHAQLVHTPIPGQATIPVQSMTACFRCHNAGGQPSACSYCHSAPHPDRGPCQNCHNLKTWVPGAFHHPVPLVAAHATILCEQCHTQASGSNMGFAAGCVNCHGNHHHDPRLTECAKCHTTTHFVPSTFVHKQVGPHVPAGEQPLPCVACHQKSFATATCSCHGGNPPTGG
ncbi:MAG: NapC/NirT family cytochrome c [Actinomycetota bacterium]